VTGQCEGPLKDPLISAIDAARQKCGFSAAAAEKLFNDFTKPKPKLLRLIFELCDPVRRADPFVTRDALAAFMRDVLTKGRDRIARWADLTPRERRQVHGIERFAQDKRRVLMGGGRPPNVDRALILYVIRPIEEATGLAFRFARPGRLNFLGGPMLRLAETALRRLFRIADSPYLGLVSPARHYTRKEIARTAELARGASSTSPAKWQSDLILAHKGEVRSALVDKKNKARYSALPSLWVITSEMVEKALAGGRQARLEYGPELDTLKANLKSGAQPDLIKLSKERLVRLE
jgi:hypothetical protein